MRLSKKVQKLGSYFGIIITKSEAASLGVDSGDRVVNVAVIVDGTLVFAEKTHLYKFFDRYVIYLPKSRKGFFEKFWRILYLNDKDVTVIISKDDDEFTKEIAEYIAPSRGAEDSSTP